jgi:hypothetical protein
MSLITDHKVTFRSEAFLSEVATVCRKLGTPPGSDYVNLQTILDELQAHGVESIYPIRGMARKGTLTIEIIEDDPHDFPAFVKFSPRLTLYVQKRIWSRFKEGQSAERVIIAHEIGHIMLHSDEAKPFVGAPNLETKFIEEGHYAEWQADTFADHLLIPTELAQRLDDSDKVAFAANVPERFAMRRLSNVRKIKKALNATSGEPCPGCGNFTLVEAGSSRKCSLCGFSMPLRILDHASL